MILFSYLISTVNIQKPFIILTLVGTPAFGLIKATVFIQYYVQFYRLRWMRICVWIGGIVSGIFYGFMTLAALILGIPRPEESLAESVGSWRYAKLAELMVPLSIFGMLCDWYLLVLPFPALFVLHMSRMRKSGILSVFTIGCL